MTNAITMNRYVYKFFSLVFLLFFIYCLIQFISTDAFKIRAFRKDIDTKLVIKRIMILIINFSISLFLLYIDKKKNRKLDCSDITNKKRDL